MDDLEYSNHDEVLGVLPPDLRGRVKAELVPGESLIWAGRGSRSLPALTDSYRGYEHHPAALAIFAVGSLSLSVVILALLMGVFGFDAAGPGGPDERLVAKIGCGFLAIVGVLTMFGAIWKWIERRRRRRTEDGRLYALTDRRVISWEPNWQATGIGVYSDPLGSIRKIHRVEYPDGLGDVCFSSDRPDLDNPGILLSSGFHRIDEPRRVEQFVKVAVERFDLRQTG